MVSIKDNDVTKLDDYVYEARGTSYCKEMETLQKWLSMVGRLKEN